MRGAAHFSAFEAIRLAMEIEHREHRFFVALARKTKREALREVFSRIAQDKAALLRSLRLRLGQYPHEGFWDDEEEILPYLQRLPDDLANVSDKARNRVRGLSTDSEALTLAIEVEDNLAAYFRDTAERSTHPDGGEVFVWLAQEKDRHVHLLRASQSLSEMEGVPG